MFDKNIFLDAIKEELENILQYWILHAPDLERGGFYGSIDNFNGVQATASKSLVLNARILWTFAAAFNNTAREQYLASAQRAYQYLHIFFTDKEFGGVYWSVDANGKRLSDRKQVYGHAFYLYGLSEYYNAVKDPMILKQAIELFDLIEEKSFDGQRKGYIEAFTRNWQYADDLRLSEKDANQCKTMNTHLHIVEAYANLYKVWPDPSLKQKIVGLLQVFDAYMIDKATGHLRLFFDKDWNETPDVISYGHDIEAAWLLQQCAISIQDGQWVEQMKQHALLITNAAMEGLDADGGLWYEYDPKTRQLVKEKHWWPQAEAMLGFFNAWEITGSQHYLQASVNSWHFIKNFLLDKKYGEWFWGINENRTVMKNHDKIGFWKCPYHNSRACMEIVRRIQSRM